MLDYDRLDLGAFERGAIIRAGRTLPPARRPAAGARAQPACSRRGCRRRSRRRCRAAAPAWHPATRRRRRRRCDAQASRARRSSGSSLRSCAASSSRSDSTTSSRFLDFVLQSFADGPAALPGDGMGAIATQLADGLDVRTGTAVATVGPNAGVARDGRAAAGRRRRRRHCRHRRRAGARVERRHLRLLRRARSRRFPGRGSSSTAKAGPINNLCVPSEAAPSYAPAGRSLVSLTILGAGEPDLDAVDAASCAAGSEPASTEWRHLRSYRIPRALPAYPVGGFGEQPVRLADGPLRLRRPSRAPVAERCACLRPRPPRPCSPTALSRPSRLPNAASLRVPTKEVFR